MKTLKQNFLVFRGTRAEVDAATAIDRCIYLAWDTGELFVGNSVGTKTRYGGSVKTLSKSDIVQFINEMFLPQVAQLNSDTLELKAEFQQTTDKVMGVVNDIDAMKDDVHAYAEKAIDDVLKQSESITEILANSFATKDDVTELRKYILETFIPDDYYKKTELYNKTESEKIFISAMNGNDLYTDFQNNKSMKKTYLALSDYSGNNISIEKGCIYTILNSGLQKITSAGSSSGSDTPVVVPQPSFSLFRVYGSRTNKEYNGTTYYEAKIEIDGTYYSIMDIISNTTLDESIDSNSYSWVGANYDTPGSVKIQMVNSNKAKSVMFYINNVLQNVGLTLSDVAQTKQFTVPAGYSTGIGRNVFSLRGLKTSDGSQFSGGDIYITVKRPFYYGLGTANAPTKMTSKITANASGNYSLTVTDSENSYIWFAFPSGSYKDAFGPSKTDFVKDNRTNFEIPFDNDETYIGSEMVDYGEKYNYTFYRSCEGILAGQTVSFNLATGSSNI